ERRRRAAPAAATGRAPGSLRWPAAQSGGDATGEPARSSEPWRPVVGGPGPAAPIRRRRRPRLRRPGRLRGWRPGPRRVRRRRRAGLRRRRRRWPGRRVRWRGRPGRWRARRRRTRRRSPALGARRTTMMRVHESSTGRCCRLVLSMGVLWMLSADAVRAEEASGPKTFAQPEEAIPALGAAAKKDDAADMIAILGPDADKVVSSGDPIADAGDRKWFVSAASARTTFEKLGDDRVIAQVGRDAWPMPIPLVKSGDTWHFDTKA